MKIVIKPIVRWPRASLGVIGFLALWAFMVVVGRLYTHYTGSRLDMCLFHALTGYSCPACGTTRGVLALARGAWREAFAWNPLTMTSAAVGSVALMGRLITAKTLAFEFTRLEQRALVILGLLILGINWAWLIYSHP